MIVVERPVIALHGVEQEVRRAKREIQVVYALGSRCADAVVCKGATGIPSEQGLKRQVRLDKPRDGQGVVGRDDGPVHRGLADLGAFAGVEDEVVLAVDRRAARVVAEDVGILA